MTTWNCGMTKSSMNFELDLNLDIAQDTQKVDAPARIGENY